jgi:hypothetical protein
MKLHRGAGLSFEEPQAAPRRGGEHEVVAEAGLPASVDRWLPVGGPDGDSGRRPRLPRLAPSSSRRGAPNRVS